MAADTRMLPILSDTSGLPVLYATWIRNVLDGPLPSESHATCHDCAMAKPIAAAVTAHTVTFSAGVKCCSYMPTLPNFLVGCALDDESDDGAVGRASVSARIAREDGVTPLGLTMPADYAVIYQHTSADLFGRHEALLCPHFVAAGGGVCGIWKYRNAVCTTYFCKFERGAVGKSFWGALHRFLDALERRIALWCAAELCGGIDRLGRAMLLYSEGARALGVEGAPSDTRQPARNVWGTWSGDAHGFYREAAHMVQALSWAEVAEIGGLSDSPSLTALRRAYDAVWATDVPDRLRLVAVDVVRRDAETSVVSSYDNRDLLILPTEIADALIRFDGRRSTTRVLADLAAEGRACLDLPTVRRLVDFGVLVPMPQLGRTALGRALAVTHVEGLPHGV